MFTDLPIPIFADHEDLETWTLALFEEKLDPITFAHIGTKLIWRQMLPISLAWVVCFSDMPLNVVIGIGKDVDARLFNHDQSSYP